ncbi:Fc.00g000810.m01.CDS01 [Cosmosporella sp. VM-42]
MRTSVQTTQAIVSHPPEARKRKCIFEQVHVGEPAEYEAVVEMVASGVCHTDLGCGTAPDGTPGFPVHPYPRVSGHEGAAYVCAVGSKTTKVKPGDAVLLSFAFCTQCRNCQFGDPGYCHKFSALKFTGTKNAFQFPKDAAQEIRGSFFGQSSFSKLTRVQETSLVNVSKLIRHKDDLKLLALLGCGFQTGAGTVTELASTKPDDKVAITGLGGVGLAAIMTTDIWILEKLLGDGYISRESVDRREMCAKFGKDGKDFDGGALQRDFACFSQISTLNSQETSRVNVPNLLGLIETPSDGKVIGILEELIPHPECQELSSFAMIEDVSAIPKQRRKAWATHIRRTVGWLHDDGIIWGDGKADNVLIHPDSDEPGLIDFGGGTTPGWVDEHLPGSIDGDNQAVRRIFEFPEVEFCFRRAGCTLD